MRTERIQQRQKLLIAETGEMLEDVVGVEISIDSMGVEAAIIMSGVSI